MEKWIQNPNKGKESKWANENKWLNSSSRSSNNGKKWFRQWINNELATGNFLETYFFWTKHTWELKIWRKDGGKGKKRIISVVDYFDKKLYFILNFIFLPKNISKKSTHPIIIIGSSS